MAARNSSGAVVRWTGTVRDVTKHKRAEEALRESQERYELAMAASESGYWDWDVPPTSTSSRRAYEMGGYDPDTWKNRDDYKARINMHPEDFARWEAAREALFAGTGERLAMEVRYIVRGETRWHSLQAICRRDDAGKVIRWTGSTTDVTERKRAEEAQRESEQRYARVVSASDEAFWDWNAAVDELYLSPRFLDMFDFPPDTTFPGRAAFFESLADFGGGPRGNAACGRRALRREDRADGNRDSCFGARRGAAGSRLPAVRRAIPRAR